MNLSSEPYLGTLAVNHSFETKCVYDKVAGAGANCDHQNSKLRPVAGAEGFRFAELRVRQLKIGRKSCFDRDLHG